MTWSEFRRGLETVKTTGRLPATVTTLDGKPCTLASALIALGDVEINPTNPALVRLTDQGLDRLLIMERDDALTLAHVRDLNTAIDAVLGSTPAPIISGSRLIH